MSAASLVALALGAPQVLATPAATPSAAATAEPTAARAPTVTAEPIAPPATDGGTRFFGTVGAGAGLFRATSGSSGDLRRFHGSTLSLEAHLGGQPSRQVAFGGVLGYDHVFGLSARDETADGDEPTLGHLSLALWSFGVFLDWHPLANAGVHARLDLTLSWLAVERAVDVDVDDPFGPGIGLAVGYDFALGDDVSVGPLVRLTIAPLSVDEGTGKGDIDVDVLLPALLGVVTFR